MSRRKSRLPRSLRAIVLALAVSPAALTYPVLAGGTPVTCTFDWLPGEGHPGVTGDLPVWALTAWDPDGAGAEPEVLVAGGGFEGAGGVATFGIALWNGTQWQTLGGGGMNNQVFAVAVYNGDVIAAGDFTTVSGASANRIARWDGNTWQPLGSGLNNSTRSLGVYNGELSLGGWFILAGGSPNGHWARWGAACARGDVNCDEIIDLDDVEPFVAGLLDPMGADACTRAGADANGDGLLDGHDVSSLVDCVLAGGCP